MFTRCVKRLFLGNINFPKCNIYELATVSDIDLKKSIGKHKRVQGWVQAVRDMKGVVFIDLTDGLSSEILQIVLPKDKKPKSLCFGCSIMVEGQMALGRSCRLELLANDITLLGTCPLSDKYPFLPRKQYSNEYIRKYLHLRPRTKAFASLLRLRNLATIAITEHFHNMGYINVHTPILTSNDCEGAGELFLVKPQCKKTIEAMKKSGLSHDEIYFNHKTYLTVSGQLHLEAIARALTKVYTFGPTFRAENSKSRLHLSEFYMLEAELAFVTDICNVMDDVEHLVKAITESVFTRAGKDIELVGASEPKWLSKKFPRLTYDEAFTILENHKDKIKPIQYGNAFSKEHELFLVEYNDNTPTFVVNWPKEDKPFYMKACENDPSKVSAMDLLAPQVGELVGGSIREDNYENLKLKLPSPSLSWYLQLRKYGNVTTGGFGMGFERYLQCVFNIPNIKDAIPFPRWPHNCKL